MKGSEIKKLAEIIGKRSFSDIAVITGNDPFDYVGELTNSRINEVNEITASLMVDPITWLSMLKDSELDTLAEMCTDEEKTLNYGPGPILQQKEKE